MNYAIVGKIIQVILALLMIFLVLIQSKSNGLSYGLKSSFSMYRSLRGVERLIFISTVVCGVLLVVNSLLIVILK